MRLRSEQIDLTTVVRNVVEDHRSQIEEASLNLVIHIPSHPIWTLGDETRLAQALGNLLQNAVKFTDSHGEIRVSLTVRDSNAILAVSDTGAGITSEVLSRIFEAFNQDERTLARTRGGLGLGLALVKGVVELHNGDVTAFSNGPGQGAKFEIKLPVLVSEAATNVLEITSAEKRSLRILIIEDNEDAAEMLSALLEVSGHVVNMCHDGEAGLQKAREFRPDFILCDIGLPEPLDGYAVARAIRKDVDLNSCFLIALTGYGQDKDRMRTQEAGFDLHLTKPISSTELERALLSAKRPKGVGM